jgi:flagellar biosynthesis component FlhA
LGRTIGRIFASLAAIVALAVGILGLVPICPTWVWITLGALGLVLIVGQYIWETQGRESEGAPRRVKQSQDGGRKSTNNQAGRDININQPPREG